MTLKEVREYLKSKKEMPDYILGSVYHLVKSGFNNEPLNSLDELGLDIMIENLHINSEIITSENMNEYPEEFLLDRIGKIGLNRIRKNDNLFCILDYYTSTGQQKRSRIILDENYKW